jgi:putative transposase
MGLIPKYGGGRPSQLSEQNKAELKEILSKRDDWTTKEIKKLIKDEFGPNFSEKHVRVILKELGLKFAKPHPLDYRRPLDAENQLKKT